MRYGTITTANVDEFAAKLEKMLTDKAYVFVYANEFFGYRPEVRTDQRLESVKVLRMEEHPDHATVMISDTYGVGSISKDAEFSFDHEYDPRTLHVEHKAPAGHNMHWVWKVQE